MINKKYIIKEVKSKMIGEGQDAKILPNGEGLTHREMNWFKTGGRGLNGEFSETTGVIHCNNEARRKVVYSGRK